MYANVTRANRFNGKGCAVTIKTFLAAALSVATSQAFAWWSTDGEQPYGKMDGGFVTPHLDIAKRSAHGTLKVFTTAFGPGQREVIELHERFDMGFVHFPTWKLGRFYPFDGAPHKFEENYSPSMDAKGYAEASEAILAKLSEVDALLLGKLDPALKMPEGFLDRLLGKVSSGAGCVWIAPRGEKVEIPGATLLEMDPEEIFPVSLVPRLADVRCFEGRLGRGRVLEVVYGKTPIRAYERKGEDAYLEPLTPFESDHPLYYDFYYAFLGKCMWRVCGISPARTGAMRSEITLDAHGEELPPSCSGGVLKFVKWRDAEGRTVDYTIERPSRDRSGAAYVALRFEKDGFRPDEPVVGEVSVTGGGGMTLEISLTDDRGRTIWRERRVPVEGVSRLSVPLLHQQSRSARVRAELRDASGSLCAVGRASVYFDTAAEDRRDFVMTVWSQHAYESRLSRYALEQMRREGVDNVMDPNPSGIWWNRRLLVPRRIKDAGLNYSAYCTRILGPNKAATRSADCAIMRQWEDFCNGKPFDRGRGDSEKFRHGGEIFDIAAAARGLGTFFYNIGDENYLFGGPRRKAVELENCFCGECQRRFRMYLRRVYGSIDAMNREYHTAYMTWEEVSALPFAEAGEKRLMTLWADFRMFMEEQFIGLHLFVKAKIESEDPGAIVGCEGMTLPANSFAGWDFAKFLPRFRFAAPYFNDRDAHALDYLPEDSVKGAWYGSYEGVTGSDHTRRAPWRHLFAGLGGSFWWTAGFRQKECTFSKATAFRPDLTLLRQFRDSAAEIQFIRNSGLGMLYRGSRRYASGVMMHYSMPCKHAATISASTVNPRKTDWEIAVGEFSDALAESSLDYAYLDDAALARGVPEGCRMLVLPCSQALSLKECASLRAFVERGGVLVADVLPGMMTEHCQTRDVSPVADLFNKKPLRPKRTGLGCTLLIGDRLRDIDKKIATNSAGGIAAGIMAIASFGGARPFAEVTDENGSLRRSDIRVNGDLVIVGMLGPAVNAVSMANAEGAEAGTKSADAVGGSVRRVISLSSPMWCYDMGRGGVPLGKSDRFEVNLETIIGRVLVFSEKEVAKPSFTLSSGHVRQGESLGVEISEVRGCAIMSVLDVGGTLVFERRVVDGHARFVPDFDMEGEYVIRVKNAVGGLASERRFEVLARVAADSANAVPRRQTCESK